MDTVFLRVICFTRVNRRPSSFYWVCVYLHMVSTKA